MGYGGMGYGMGYGGYGMGGGGNGVGMYLGLSLAETFIREQQRQAFLQQQLRTQQELGQDQAAIAALQRELAEQNSKVEALKAQGAGAQAPPAAAPTSDAAVIEQLKAQLAAQQAEINAMK